MKKLISFLAPFIIIGFLGACDDDSNPVKGYPDTPYTKRLKSFTIPNDMIDSVHLNYGQNGQIDTTWAYEYNGNLPYIKKVTFSEADGDTIYDIERSFDIGFAQDTSYWKIEKKWEGQTKTLTYYYDTKTKGQEANIKKTISYTYEGSKLSHVVVDESNRKKEITLSGDNPLIMTINTIVKDQPLLKDSIWAEIHTIDKVNPIADIDFLADGQIQTWFYMSLTPKLVEKAKLVVEKGITIADMTLDFNYTYDESGHPIEIKMDSDNNLFFDYGMILKWE
jgi:hypothetical protein